MVHDFELSVSAQVHLGETWALTTGLQRCDEDRLLPEVPQPRLMDSDIDKIVTSYLVDIWPEF